MLNIKILAKNQSEYEQFNVNSLSVYYHYDRLYHLEQGHIEGTDIIVVLSPLTREEQKILTLNSSKISFLVFIGVIIELKETGVFKYFSTNDELVLLIRGVEIEYIERLKQDYLSVCLPMSIEDEQYLENLTSEGSYHEQFVPQKKVKKFKTIRKKVYASKGMVSLVGSSRLAIEIVRAYQRYSKHKILFIDGNLLKPTLDAGFNIRDIETKIKSHLTGVDNTGLNIMLDAINKSIPINHIINQVVYPYSKSLDLLFGNYNFYNYEHYDIDTLNRLFAHLKNHYTIIFVVLDKQFYDEFTLLSLHKSDINIFIGDQELSDVRFLYNTNNVLEHKQGIQKNKNYFAFNRVLGEKLVSSSVIKTLFKDQVISCHHLKAKNVAKSIDRLLEKKRT